MDLKSPTPCSKIFLSGQVPKKQMSMCKKEKLVTLSVGEMKWQGWEKRKRTTSAHSFTTLPEWCRIHVFVWVKRVEFENANRTHCLHATQGYK